MHRRRTDTVQTTAAYSRLRRPRCLAQRRIGRRFEHAGQWTGRSRASDRTVRCGRCSGEFVCVNQTCVDGLQEGDACTSFGTCHAGLVCREDVCVRAQVVGGACAVTAECPVGHACVAGACAPFPRAGDACTSAAPCLTGVCNQGTCTWLVPGQRCDFVHEDFQDNACLEGKCVGGICVGLVPAGGACRGVER